MSQIADKDIRTHVSIIGWGLIIYNALALALGLDLFLLMAGVGFFAGDAQAFGILALMALVAAGFALVLSVPGIVAGWGLLKRKNWARILAIVVAAFNLFEFPIGTIVAVYVLWVLLQRSAESYFAPQAGAEMG